jgi:hypothetical protein
VERTSCGPPCRRLLAGDLVRRMGASGNSFKSLFATLRLHVRILFGFGLTIPLALGHGGTAAAQSAFRPHFDLTASVVSRAAWIDGRLTVTFANPSRRTIEEAIFVLFPNRFSAPDEGINDVTRPFVYPRMDFVSGSMELLDVHDGGSPVAAEPFQHPGVPNGCLLRVAIAPLAPGETRRLTARFRTRVPHRFGPFGAFEDQLTLIGGWHPYLAGLDGEGTWRVERPPPLADFAVTLSSFPAMDLVLNGRHFRRGEEVEGVSVRGVHYLSLVAAPELERRETMSEGTRIVYLRRRPRRASRISTGPAPPEITLATLAEIVSRRPSELPALPPELTVVEAPLRLRLTADGEGAAVVSDRALKVHRLLRPFHELQIARAVYAEILRPHLSSREPAEDYPWVSEGLSRVFAERFVDAARPDARSVDDWIDLFNVFAIVDRFENEPKIPFVDTFFDRARVPDPLHAEITTFNNSVPPGRVTLRKLQDWLGEPAFDELLERCAGGDLPIRRCAGSVEPGRDLDERLAEWLQPYPRINYRFSDVELNRPDPEGYRSSVEVRRESSRPFTEPVTVRLRSIGGNWVDLRWDGEGETARLSTVTAGRMHQALIDPERRLIEERRDDNTRPPTPQVVLDSADVDITSTEFGISGLFVGRARYDYRKDLAAAGFFTNRSLGLTFGPRWHGGRPNDATTYRHNVYGFYGFQALDGSFKDKRRPSVRTDGQLASLGVRYDYTNVFSFDNPTDQRALRLYVDWFDRGLGGDFDYVDWGISAVGTQPLGSRRTLAALHILNGFSEPIGGSIVPNQGLYSLGGARSIRGIGVQEELARNILLVRTELRQEVYPEVDLNFLDLFVLRRSQVRLFADSGRVDNSAGRVYDVGRFALGVGLGFAAVYEFMGFFPSLAYIEIATRLDEPRKADDVQFLFGTRQSF